VERLDWLDGQWIRRLPPRELASRALPFLVEAVAAAASDGYSVRNPAVEDLVPLLPMVVERLPRLDAIGPMLDFVFIDDLEIDPTLLVPKRWDAATTETGLTEAERIVEELGEEEFGSHRLEPALRELCELHGWKVGDLFMAIRVALTGRTATPPLFDVMAALGYETTLDRLAVAGEVATMISAEEL